jgi:ankyrin repeat protein
MMVTPTVGEMTVKAEMRFSIHDRSFFQSVYRSISSQARRVRSTSLGSEGEAGDDYHAVVEALAPTLLCSAAGDGALDTVKEILLDENHRSGNGADLADYDGRTALHLASSAGQTAVVDYLVATGANLNSKDRWNNTPLKEAVYHQNDALAKSLHTAGAALGMDESFLAYELCRLAHRGEDADVELLRLLLESGADVAVADYDGRTALHVAASDGHAACVEVLLSYGAPNTAEDRWGNTPHDDAVRGKHDACVAMLAA